MTTSLRHAGVRTLLSLAALCLSSIGAIANEDLGKEVFTEIAEPGCGLCHTLQDAEASGEIGPNLDEMELTEDQVRAAVTQGVGVMPAFNSSLDEEQIDAVAAYVVSVAGR